MTDKIRKSKRVVQVFRYDPAVGGDGHYDRFELEIEDESITTILDVLLRIQRDHDPSLAFRYSCRISMCGSCGMVVNGEEGLACQTVVANLKEGEITIRPLNHFPVIRDLVVDMDPFFKNFDRSLAFFEPREQLKEPAIIRPDSKERRLIADYTECIACGCCVSSCTMANWYEDYLGPGALNRAFTLLLDSRDGLHDERLARVLSGCYNCRTELNCTEVCPKEISPTRSLKYIQILAAKNAFKKVDVVDIEDKATEIATEVPVEAVTPEVSRRRFLSRITLGLGGIIAVLIGGLMTATSLVPAMRKRAEKWVKVGKVDAFPVGAVRTVPISYKVKDGIYESTVTKPVFVYRDSGSDGITVFNSRCTHLACVLHWDEKKQLFLCDCHGGQFYPDGRVKAGPPPSAMDRYPTKVENGNILVREA